MPIKYLILSGGGVRGYAILGSLNYLVEKGIIKQNLLRTFAGSSVGAIICLLLNCGYTPQQIYDIGLDLDLKSMFNPDIKKVLTHFGFDTGTTFVNKLKTLLKQKHFDPNITFIRLYNITKQKLIVTATSLNRRTTKYFNYVETPNYKVIDVIRASMGIPILFTTVKDGDEHFVDGGMLDNFPVHLFKDVPFNEIIAIKFRKTKEKEPHQRFVPIVDFIDVVLSNVACLLEEIEYLRSLLAGKAYTQSTIFIDTHEYHMLSLEIDDKDKKALFGMGCEAAKVYTSATNYIKSKIDELPNKIRKIIWNYVHSHHTSCVCKELLDKFDNLKDTMETGETMETKDTKET